MTNTINSFRFGYFSLKTLAAMVADMCESLLCERELATDTFDIVEAAERLAKVAGDINNTLAQIAVIVVYCEASYGVNATTEYLATAGANPDLIAEARQRQQEPTP